MKKILIDGMMCSQCVTVVENKLKNLGAVREVNVILESGEVFLEGNISDELLKAAIESEGYKITGIKEINRVKPKNTSVRRGFFSKLIDKIGNSNENTFGEGYLDCCDLNKKDK